MNRPGKSKGFNGFNETHARVNGIGILPVAAVAVGTKVAPLLAKLKPVAKLINGVKNLLSKFSVGQPSQTRFLARYKQIRNIFSNGKYLVVGSPWHEAALTRHKIRATQIDDHSKDYREEFGRLRQWVIDVMNTANPGLGTDFGALIPEFKMANKGQIHGIYDDLIKAIVDAVPPNNYIPGTLQEVVKLESDKLLTSPSTNGTFVEQLEGGYKVVKDAQGKILEIRDVAGKILSPESSEYDNVVQKGAGGSTPTEAGFDTASKIVLSVVALSALVYAGGKMKNPKKPVNGLPEKKKYKKKLAA
jgi:hypothetical protein